MQLGVKCEINKEEGNINDNFPIVVSDITYPNQSFMVPKGSNYDLHGKVLLVRWG